MTEARGARTAATTEATAVRTAATASSTNLEGPICGGGVVTDPVVRDNVFGMCRSRPQS
jgi:hypothetical protein